MKKIISILAIITCLYGCNTVAPTTFSKEALNDEFLSLQGSNVKLSTILDKHKGKNIIIDIWASWCGDCIKGMPKVKILQKQYPDAVYIFLSLDRNEDAWKRGIVKYGVTGEHYFMLNGKKGAFADFVDIGWIPRYMLVNKTGKIVVFDVIEADDKKLVEALKK